MKKLLITLGGVLAVYGISLAQYTTPGQGSYNLQTGGAGSAPTNFIPGDGISTSIAGSNVTVLFSGKTTNAFNATNANNILDGHINGDATGVSNVVHSALIPSYSGQITIAGCSTATCNGIYSTNPVGTNGSIGSLWYTNNKGSALVFGPNGGAFQNIYIWYLTTTNTPTGDGSKDGPLFDTLSYDYTYSTNSTSGRRDLANSVWETASTWPSQQPTGTPVGGMTGTYARTNYLRVVDSIPVLFAGETQTNILKETIGFIGDSITMGTGDGREGPTGMGVENAAATCFDLLSRAGFVNGFVNVAKGSSTADGFRTGQNWTNIFVAHNVKTAFIMFGVNDAGNAVTPNTYSNQVLGIITNAMNNGVKRVILNYPLGSPANAPALVTNNQYQAALLGLANGSNIFVGDTNSWYQFQTNYVAGVLYGNDQIHPNTQGHTLLGMNWANGYLKSFGALPITTPTCLFTNLAVSGLSMFNDVMTINGDRIQMPTRNNSDTSGINFGAGGRWGYDVGLRVFFNATIGIGNSTSMGNGDYAGSSFYTYMTKNGVFSTNGGTFGGITFFNQLSLPTNGVVYGATNLAGIYNDSSGHGFVIPTTTAYVSNLVAGTVSVTGGITAPTQTHFVTVTNNYNMDPNDVWVFIQKDGATITLPSSPLVGHAYHICCSEDPGIGGRATATVTTIGNLPINASIPPQTIGAGGGEVWSLVWDGVSWWIFSKDL